MIEFLVTGATGKLGAATVEALLEHVPATSVRVLVRDAQRAEHLADHGLRLRIGDYSDRGSLDAAVDGVERIVFVSSPVLDPVTRAAQHRNVVAAAVAGGIHHVVYTSAMGAPHDPGHMAAETALSESGIGHTILRNALYTDPFVVKALDEARSASRIVSASEGMPITTAALADLGAAAASAVVTPPSRTLWELRGPAWTFDQLAVAVTHRLQRPIRHEEVSDDQTGPFAVLFPLIRRGVFSAETTDLAKLLGRRPQGIADVVELLG